MRSRDVVGPDSGTRVYRHMCQTTGSLNASPGSNPNAAYRSLCSGWTTILPLWYLGNSTRGPFKTHVKGDCIPWHTLNNLMLSFWFALGCERKKNPRAFCLCGGPHWTGEHLCSLEMLNGFTLEKGVNKIFLIFTEKKNTHMLRGKRALINPLPATRFPSIKKSQNGIPCGPLHMVQSFRKTIRVEPCDAFSLRDVTMSRVWFIQAAWCTCFSVISDSQGSDHNSLFRSV